MTEIALEEYAARFGKVPNASNPSAKKTRTVALFFFLVVFGGKKKQRVPPEGDAPSVSTATPLFRQWGVRGGQVTACGSDGAADRGAPSPVRPGVPDDVALALAGAQPARG